MDTSNTSGAKVSATLASTTTTTGFSNLIADSLVANVFPVSTTKPAERRMEHKQDIGHKEPNATEDEVTFFHDFVAGGVAGSASVIVGHPFDTIKVRLQTSSGEARSLWSMATQYGGVSSLFRGMAAPLGSASVVNAIIFSSYGWSSRVFDQYAESKQNQQLLDKTPIHDSTIKAFTCGSFAGLTQALVICPMEHIKCRLQVQHGKGSADNLYKGPIQALKSIVRGHGISGLYRGWCVTTWREVPAFGAYFAMYDILKDSINSFFERQEGIPCTEDLPAGSGQHTHTWVASALAGGTTGALTWAAIYPFDVIKTKIQTAPMDTPVEQRRLLTVGKEIVRQHGWRYMFRGLGVTIIRAFPVNGIIFPVYEFTLMQVAALEY